MKKKITYEEVGDNYTIKDPIKKLAQTAAAATGKNLKHHGFSEITDSRGESAYVWQQGSTIMAAAIEGLGTKNLVADAMYKLTGKTYYDVIGFDTVAAIVNDLTSVGASPLVVNAYWAMEDNSWLADEKRLKDLIKGWQRACDLAGVSWGGGETPTIKGIVVPETCELGGSAVGIIKSSKHLITDKKLKSGDRILLLQSNGVNANGFSLARAIAKKLAKGYATKLTDGTLYGEALLTRTNLYTSLIQDLLANQIDIHYIVNITGHGIRKIMRARQDYTYVLEKLFEPQEVFTFMQKHAGLSDEEAYGTWNMGQDYAIFLPQKHIAKALRIVAKHKFTGLDAGYVEEGEKQVIVRSKNIVYTAHHLDLR